MSEDQLETVEEMFVHLASGLTSTPDTLTTDVVVELRSPCLSDGSAELLGE